MDFPNKPVRKGEVPSKPKVAVFHRRHVVRSLHDIVNWNTRDLIHLVKEQVGQGGLCSFDLGGEYRLLSDVDVHEERAVGQQSGHAVQPAKADSSCFQR